jgi:hypothetical protein
MPSRPSWADRRGLPGAWHRPQLRHARRPTQGPLGKRRRHGAARRDPHKDTHTVVAVDRAGRQLDQRTVPARMLGHGELVGWARIRWPERIWAVEDLPPGVWPAGTRPAGRRGASRAGATTADSRGARLAQPPPPPAAWCRSRSARLKSPPFRPHRPDRSAGPATPPAGRPAGPSLLRLPGCGPLIAAKLIAESACVARFRPEACFAMHAGVAPIPVSSGRGREQAQPSQEQPPPEGVGQPAAQQHQPAEAQPVGGHHPGERGAVQV